MKADAWKDDFENMVVLRVRDNISHLDPPFDFYLTLDEARQLMEKLDEAVGK